MKLLGNIIWVVFGGFFMSIGYLISGLIMMVTIIGIPFGWQIIKLGLLALWPFGKEVCNGNHVAGCLSTIMNLIWILIGGIWIALGHAVFGAIFYITIIGIPFGKQHFKLAHIALTPFGRQIVSSSKRNID